MGTRGRRAGDTSPRGGPPSADAIQPAQGGQRPVPSGARWSLTRPAEHEPLVSGHVAEKNEVKKNAGKWVFVEDLTSALSRGIFLMPVRAVVLFTATH